MNKNTESLLTDLLEVALLLDAYQRDYDRNTYHVDRMPGNDVYSGRAMAIVVKARLALGKAARLAGE